MYCTNCGFGEHNENARFCKNCGTSLYDEDVSQTKVSDTAASSEHNIYDILDPEVKMKRDLVQWGIVLAIVGVIHMSYNIMWGCLLFIVGVAALLVGHRGMYIAIGIVLLIAGLCNLFTGETGWQIFGAIQVIWGVWELDKYRRFSGLNDNQADLLN